MDTSAVSSIRKSTGLALDIPMLLAFAAIYFLWGGTFLAIRIAVLQLPPCFTAGCRFFAAGLLLHVFLRLRGAPNPTRTEWRNLAILGLCMFVLTYGPLFWAEQYVTSSITSLIEATLPITAFALEVLVFRTQRAQWQTMTGVAVGFGAVALLLLGNQDQHVPVGPSLVILAAGVAWSFGAVLSNHLALPKSRPLTASGQMMLGGAVLLGIAAARGEFKVAPHFTTTTMLAMGYLITFGSLIAYTAYVWLLGRVSVTRVSSHAYVNPLVAVALGYFFADDVITVRTVVAMVLIVCSVALILTRPQQQA